MKYGKHLIQRTQFVTYTIALLGVLYLVSCSANNRVQRILKNHPELVQNRFRDSIFINEGKIIDTQVVFKTTHDTIQYGGISIIRASDTIRIFGRTEPCTTIIRKQFVSIGDTYRPSRAEIRQQRKKTKEKETERRGNNKYRYFLIISLVANAYLLMTNIILRHLNKQNNA
jgi:hypothetical protein